MLFNSFSFAVFLPIVFCIYWSLPHKHRWFCLLLASYYFYMSWNAKYALLILLSTAITYVSGLLLERISYSKFEQKLDKCTVYGITDICNSLMIQSQIALKSNRVSSNDRNQIQHFYNNCGRNTDLNIITKILFNQ